MKQRDRHRPGDGVWGDCHRAAIASLLNLPYEDVPHFADGGPSNEEFIRREREFLLARGLVPISLAYQASDAEPVLRCIKAQNPDMYYLLGGKSSNGVMHTVVCLNDQIVHDPSLDNSGIVGPDDDGLMWATFLGHPSSLVGGDEPLDGDWLLGIGAKGGHDEADTDVYTLGDAPKVMVALRYSRGELVSSSLSLTWCYAGPPIVSLHYAIADDPCRGDVLRLLKALAIEHK